MRTDAHRRIFILLAVCATGILLLQAYWIMNFYKQVKARFASDVYSGLETVVRKLQEREQLRVLREKETGFSFSSKKSKGARNQEQTDQVVMVSTPRNARRIETKKVTTMSASRMPAAQTTREDFFMVNSSTGTIEHTMTLDDSAGNGDPSVTTSFSFVTGDEPDSIHDREVERLMDRLLMEVRIVDSDQKNSDSIKAVLTSALSEKGIFTPFEFSLRKIIRGTDKVITQTPGFDSTRSSYRADLSSNRVIRTNNYLFVQFPNQDQVLLSGIQGNVALSVLFLGVVLGVFYYTSRVILQLKKINDIRNDFVNNMTHELKTPIATISLAVDAMKNPAIRSDDEKYNEYTRILKDENRKLNRHVERVLQLSLLEKGEMQLRTENVDLQVLVLEVIHGYSLQTQAQQAAITFTCARPVFVQADRDHICAAVSNLLDNALKYGGEKIQITVTLEESAGKIIIGVTDNGPGISEDNSEKIFEKFYRVPNDNRHDVKGFGLGLSYVKTIAEMHGGSVRVESQHGRGATFTFHLPSHG